MLGVAAHFVSLELKNQSCLLALKQMKDSHTGTNIAATLGPILVEYGIVQQLEVFISDKIEVSDVTVRKVLKELRPDIEEPASRRACCMGHIINLAAKAFIWGKDVEAFEAVVESVDETAPSDSADLKKVWRSKGPPGKVHNICIFIKASSQRREDFERCFIGDKVLDGK